MAAIVISVAVIASPAVWVDDVFPGRKVRDIKLGEIGRRIWPKFLPVDDSYSFRPVVKRLGNTPGVLHSNLIAIRPDNHIAILQRFGVTLAPFSRSHWCSGCHNACSGQFVCILFTLANKHVLGWRGGKELWQSIQNRLNTLQGP